MNRPDRDFALLFTVMLTIAAGNTALQSVLPALGRSLGVADAGVALAFSVSALLWVLAAPFWANRSDRSGRRAMILIGMGGYTVSLTLCGLFLALGINGAIGGATAFALFVVGRMIYGGLGAAAPPAVQALVAGATTRDDARRADARTDAARLRLWARHHPGARHRPLSHPRPRRRLDDRPRRPCLPVRALRGRRVDRGPPAATR